MAVMNETFAFMESETKRLAEKYFYVIPDVDFPEHLSEHGKQLTAKCSFYPENKKWTIFYWKKLFNNCKLSDYEDRKLMLRTICHEICHLKWNHGEPEFKKNVLSIRMKEIRFYD